MGVGGSPSLRFLGRLIQPWTGGFPGIRFLGRLIQPWMGGGGSEVSDFWVG